MKSAEIGARRCEPTAGANHIQAVRLARIHSAVWRRFPASFLYRHATQDTSRALDPITHGLLAATAAQALIGRRLGYRAALFGGVAGLLPDLDVLIGSPADPLLAIEYHRQFTHALAFIPVGGTISALPWLLRERNRAQWKPLVAATTVGYATHGLLDACTTYGTQLFWPFSSYRAAFNWISIIDPVFTLALLVGVVFGLRKRTVRPPAIALTFCAAYLGIGAVQEQRALDVQRRIAEMRGHEISRGAVFPTLGNQIVWRSLYRSGDTLYANRIRVPWLGEPTWSQGNAVAALRVDEPLPEAGRYPRVQLDFERFRWFSDGWIARAPKEPEVIGDVRYSLRSDAFDPVWGVRFRPGAPVPTEWVDRSANRELALAALWAEILGRR
ncbi:MAG: metal-dependent hydrolase [Burkholderiales bacterium]|nr:metal-dependent hydrolase [Burkholderiales bacterium]